MPYSHGSWIWRQRPVGFTFAPVGLLGILMVSGLAQAHSAKRQQAEPAPQSRQDDDGAQSEGGGLPKLPRPIGLADVTYTGLVDGPGSVLITTNGSPKLRLDFVDQAVIRVWITAAAGFHKSPSTSVTQETWPPTPHQITDQGAYIRIQTAKISVRINKAPVSVDFYLADDVTPLSREDSAEAGTGSGWTVPGRPFSYRQLTDGERLYGLGQDNTEYLGRLERRGTVRTLWTGQQINRGKATADYPIPLLLSTGTGAAGGGYGLFFDNTYRTVFDLGKESSTRLRWAAEGGELIYYFLAGPSFPEILERYTALTGRAPLPPRWAYGFIQSKCSYYNWAEIDDVVSNMRSRQLPFDAMAIDFDWPEAMQNFKWNARWQGLSPAKLQEYAGSGTKFYISDTGPMIRKDSSNYQDGLSHHIFATDGAGKTLSCGYYGGDLMDFTAPAMKDWLKPQLAKLVDDGVKGWWLDLSEPEGEPPQTVYYGGSSARLHNVYSNLSTATYASIEAELRPNERPFILTRTGAAGIQRYGAAVWSGDIYSDYETMAAQVPEALSSMLSGVALWSNDSGGFLTGYYKDNLQDHGLLYERWLQFSTFVPIMRAHHVGLSAPYMFGPEVEAGTRKYLQLRYRLLPYIYSYAWQTHQTGAPLMRPLVFEAQNDPEAAAASDEFQFGHELLVAPVLKEGATARQVYLPAGRWLDYDTGHTFNGGQSYLMAAPQHHIPILVRAGAIIPLAPPALQYSDEKAWDPLTLDIYPDGSSEFNLYADDGTSFAYLRTASFTETRITSQLTPQQQEVVTIGESNKQFAPQEYALQLHLASTPTSATWNGVQVAFLAARELLGKGDSGGYWDEKAHILLLQTPSGAALNQKIVVKLAQDELGEPVLAASVP